MLQAWCRGTSSGSRALCRPAQGCRATTREPQEDRCVPTRQLVTVMLLLMFFCHFCQVSKTKIIMHGYVRMCATCFKTETPQICCITARSLHSLPRSFITIRHNQCFNEDGVYRAEAPPHLLLYYHAYRSSLHGLCQLLLVYRAPNDPSVFTIREKAPNTRAFSWLKHIE